MPCCWPTNLSYDWFVGRHVAGAFLLLVAFYASWSSTPARS